MAFYFFPRKANGEDPGGITVSKTETLPLGDFGIDEYCWPDGTVLWLITEQEFTEDERAEAYTAFLPMSNFRGVR